MRHFGHITPNSKYRGQKCPYFYLEVNLSMIRAHIHPQEGGWEMREALSTWRGLLKDLILTVYPQEVQRRLWTSIYQAPGFLVHQTITLSAILPFWWDDKGRQGIWSPDSQRPWKLLEREVAQSKHPLGTHTPDYAKRRLKPVSENRDYSILLFHQVIAMDWLKGFP